MLPPGCLAGQVAVITGGASGIGFGIAREVAQLGAHVVLAGRHPEKLEAAREALKPTGVDVLTVPTDVRQPDQVEALFRSVSDHFGRVDMLVNAAAGNFIVDSEKLSVNGWNAVVGSVLHGTFYCTRAAGLQMIASGRGGRILSIVASYAWTGGPKTVHSVAAKAGVVALTRTLAVEWAHYGIRVNALCPGPTDTEGARPLWEDPETRQRVLRRIPVGRFGTVTEVAQAASYLLSPYADFINGEVLVIDGGEWLGKGLTS
ncbi:MAG: SDR family oxidoreductase [Firmicutes bacterium]|nr:SDR family oxidoreductase [Alicyclobacillaceae bacterium]MCL6497460.1 SDR family oxidoreductase [Bacillota bacterium]